MVAIPDEFGESKFWTVAPFGALGVVCAALVTVDTPCETRGLDVDVVPWLVGVFWVAFANDRTPLLSDGPTSDSTSRDGSSKASSVSALDDRGANDWECGIQLVVLLHGGAAGGNGRPLP
jgi:hypothetical protein